MLHSLNCSKRFGPIAFLNPWKYSRLFAELESLLLDKIKKYFRESLVVFFGISDIRKHLSQWILPIFLDKIDVCRQLFLFFVKIGDVGCGIISISLLVYDSLQWNSLRFGWIIIGNADRQSHDRDNVLWKIKRFGNLWGIVCCRAEVAASKSVHLGYGAELLGEYCGVEECGDKWLEIVESWLGIAQLAPFYKTVEVGAKS